MERDSCFSKYQSQGRRDEDLHIVTSLTDKINEQISNNRKSYFLNLSNQLNDKCLNPKKYWTLLRSFYNGRKVPLIPPILKGNKYVSDFKEKVDYVKHDHDHPKPIWVKKINKQRKEIKTRKTCNDQLLLENT